MIDPLGPLGFALALHPILIKIRDCLPTLSVNCWYLDDGTLCGSPDDLCTALDIIVEEGPSSGLTLNQSKSILVIPRDDSSIDDPHPSLIHFQLTSPLLGGFYPVGLSNR